MDDDKLKDMYEDAFADYGKWADTYKEELQEKQKVSELYKQAHKKAQARRVTKNGLVLGVAEEKEPPTNDLIRKVLASQMLILKELEEIRSEINDLKSQK